jgi:small subunit ribosomal protein S19e
MANAYEIPASILISKVADALKKIETVKEPEWASFVKTGAHVERAPSQPDWWYIRCASLLRVVYTNGPVGVERLKTKYGGRKNRGVKPQKRIDASGKVIRVALQQLEESNFVQKKKGKGRIITPKGISFVDKVATSVKKNLEKLSPALAKY